MEELLKVGEKAPDFEVQQTNGKIVKLSDFKGKKIVLYFYPHNFTPGCTKQACSLRDNFKEIKKKGAVILGVSLNKVDSHKKFTKKHNLPFPLLYDKDAKISTAYGVYVQKSFLGKKFMGIKRTTFIIDENGKISNIIEEINTGNRGEQVLGVL